MPIVATEGIVPGTLGENGMTRKEALLNFLYSTEFEMVCDNYGILRGDVQ